MALRFWGSNAHSLLLGCAKANNPFTSFQPGADPADSKLLALRSLKDAVAEVAAQTVAASGGTTLRAWLATAFTPATSSKQFTSTTTTALFTVMVNTSR